jgi:hypothetical protein
MALQLKLIAVALCAAAALLGCASAIHLDSSRLRNAPHSSRLSRFLSLRANPPPANSASGATGAKAKASAPAKSTLDPPPSLSDNNDDIVPTAKHQLKLIRHTWEEKKGKLRKAQTAAERAKAEHQSLKHDLTNKRNRITALTGERTQERVKLQRLQDTASTARFALNRAEEVVAKQQEPIRQQRLQDERIRLKEEIAELSDTAETSALEKSSQANVARIEKDYRDAIAADPAVAKAKRQYIAVMQRVDESRARVKKLTEDLRAAKSTAQTANLRLSQAEALVRDKTFIVSQLSKEVSRAKSEVERARQGVRLALQQRVANQQSRHEHRIAIENNHKHNVKELTRALQVNVDRKQNLIWNIRKVRQLLGQLQKIILSEKVDLSKARQKLAAATEARQHSEALLTQYQRELRLYTDSTTPAAPSAAGTAHPTVHNHAFRSLSRGLLAQDEDEAEEESLARDHNGGTGQQDDTEEGEGWWHGRSELDSADDEAGVWPAAAPSASNIESLRRRFAGGRADSGAASWWASDGQSDTHQGSSASGEDGEGAVREESEGSKGAQDEDDEEGAVSSEQLRRKMERLDAVSEQLERNERDMEELAGKLRAQLQSAQAAVQQAEKPSSELAEPTASAHDSAPKQASPKSSNAAADGTPIPVVGGSMQTANKNLPQLPGRSGREVKHGDKTFDKDHNEPGTVIAPTTVKTGFPLAGASESVQAAPYTIGEESSEAF